MKSQLRRYLLGLTAALWLSSAHAVPFVYDEAVDGDIYYATFDNFDVGTNVVSGSTFSGPSGVDSDNFHFLIREGTQLDAVTYSFWNVEGTGSGFGVSMSSSAPFYSLGDWSINVLTDPSPVTILEEVLPLGSGYHDFRPSNWFNTGPTASGGSWDYSVSFSVSAVPLPSTLVLMLGGLLGLVAVRRRR